MKRDTIAEAIALFFAMLFVYSSLEKIIQLADNMRNFKRYPLLFFAPQFFAILLPLSELLLVYLLMTKRKIGLLATEITMLFFTGYILYMMITMDHLPCPCGGFISKLSWGQHIIFNSILALIAGLGIYIEKNSSLSVQKQKSIYTTQH